MIEGLRISENAYAYLVAQRGALDDMKGSPRVWAEKYIDVLFSEFHSIEPYLPKYCDSVLDVGSGMGGINALINSHYGGQVKVTLLDGLDDAPKVTNHRSTFNDMRVAQAFLKENGVRFVDWIDANAEHRAAPRFFDLVVSTKSWCFHYPPAEYLALVAQASIPGQTILIVDIRTEKLYEYSRAITQYFAPIGTPFRGFKFETHAFLRRLVDTMDQENAG